MADNETLNYSIKFDNPVERKSTATIWDIKDTTRWQVQKNLIKIEKNCENIMNQESIENLKWNKEKILKYLKTKCIYKKEWVEEYWEKWTHYYLTLLSVNWFECKKLDWFVSDRKVTIKEYERNEEWKSNSAEAEEISTNILWNMRNFLKELGISEDINKDFFKELFRNWRYTCKTWTSLKKVTGLDDWYRLKDTKWDWRAQRECHVGRPGCYFKRHCVGSDSANLFLWFSIKKIS